MQRKKVGDVTGQGIEKCSALRLIARLSLSEGTRRSASDHLPVSGFDCVKLPGKVSRYDSECPVCMFVDVCTSIMRTSRVTKRPLHVSLVSNLHVMHDLVLRCKIPRLGRTLELRLHGSVQISSVPLFAEQTSFSIVVCPWESCPVVPKAVASSAPPRKPRADSPGQGLNPSASDCPAKAACCREKPPGPFSCVPPGPSCPCL